MLKLSLTATLAMAIVAIAWRILVTKHGLPSYALDSTIKQLLEQNALLLSRQGYGILAADESLATIGARVSTRGSTGYRSALSIR